MVLLDLAIAGKSPAGTNPAAAWLAISQQSGARLRLLSK
jgi:hypothetical protein